MAGTAVVLAAAAFGQPALAANAGEQGNQSEVSRAASGPGAEGVTARIVKGFPKGADVALSDKAMTQAGGQNGDWRLHGRDYANTRYSPLDQIDTGNIGNLVPAAIVQTGKTASFETTPIVVDGVMYVTTPVVNDEMKIMALDAATGERLWETAYQVGTQKLCCGPVNRGVAVGYGEVFVATVDARLLALDARTGKLAWKAKLADPRRGYSETMAPQIYDGMVIVGSSGGEWPLRGFVAAYDAKSGKEKWRWHATDPDTFAGDSWKTGGGMVWTTPAIDTGRGLIIFSTGNPNPDLNGESRKGDNLYTDSIVALKADSGELAWHYQEVKHDVWDYDAVSNVVLMDARDGDGNMVPVAAEAGKVGWMFVVNRETGELIRKSDAFVMMNDKMFTPPSKEGVKILPGANGGAEWSPPAFSPETRDVYVMGLNQLMNYTLSDATMIPGQMRLGSTFKNVKEGEIQNGTFSAINVDTGKIDWQADVPQPMIGGVLATAGNLVFTGEGNGWFDAFDATTGDRVWRYQLGAGVNAPPVSYEVDGTQYVAVAAGGNFQLDYPRGDVIAIFKLAGKG